jgi:hypothetical protein
MGSEMADTVLATTTFKLSRLPNLGTGCVGSVLYLAGHLVPLSISPVNATFVTLVPWFIARPL